MSSSAYNQVPRLTTTNPLKMHHHHHSHQSYHQPPLGDGGPDVSTANYNNRQASRQASTTEQRKWRVLVSIGLLLPALAAIIGIVAWAISIEVASGAQSSAASAQVRRNGRVQQQQFRRDEAAALAAIMAARRPRVQQPVSAPLIQPQPAQQQELQPASSTTTTTTTTTNQSNAEADQRQAASDRLQTEVAASSGGQQAGSRATRTSRRQVAAAPVETKPPPQQAQRQAATARSSESLLALTNMDQVRAMSQDAPARDSSGVTLEDEQPPRMSNNKRLSPQADDSEVDAPVNQPPAEMGDENGESELSSMKPSRESKAGAPTGSEIEVESTPADEQEQPSKKPVQQQQPDSVMVIEQQKVINDSELELDVKGSVGGKAQRHRSPMMNHMKNSGKSHWQMSAGKRPQTMVVEPVALMTKRKLQQQEAGSKAKLKMMRTNSKVYSEYQMLSAGSSSSEMIGFEPSDVADSMRPNKDCDNKADSLDGDSSADPSLESPSDAPIKETQPEPMAMSMMMPMKPNESPSSSVASPDDEVSFEAIASAISMSLNNQTTDNQGSDSVASIQPSDSADQPEGNHGDDKETSEVAPAKAMAELLSQALANQNMKSPKGQQSFRAMPLPSPQESSTSKTSASTNEDHKESSMSTSSPAPMEDSVELRSSISKRRRTTGEHLAEVIDHIVEKRQKQRSSRFGERASPRNDSDQQEPHLLSNQGPQIVVVAPVGPSGALLKARSLTRATVEVSQKSETKVDPAAAASKKATEPTKKKTKTKPTRVGARLLGVDGRDESATRTEQKKTQPQVQYSERVEVIEDDDSSALLLAANSQRHQPIKSREEDKQPNESSPLADELAEEDERERLSAQRNSNSNLNTNNQADLVGQQQLAAAYQNNPEQLSSIHVSSHSGEPRLRSPRHEMSSSRTFERYAPLPQQHQAHRAQQQQQPQPQQAKLYSAEQLIREHILKSKARSVNQNQQPQQPPAAQTSQQKHQQMQTKQEAGKLGVVVQAQAPIATSTTTSRPPVPTSTEQAAPETQQQPRQQTDQVQLESSSNENAPGLQHFNQQRPMRDPDSYPSPETIKPLQVPALDMQQALDGRERHQFASRLSTQPQMAAFQPHQQPQDQFQMMESQQQQVQMRPESGYESAAPSEQQQQQTLPVFADQEIQVPAHMAESVIRDLQQASSTVTGMLNGQQMQFQAHPAMMMPDGQMAMMAPVPQQYNNYPQANQHQYQQQPLAESQPRPFYPQAKNSQQQTFDFQPSASFLNPVGTIVSRLAAVRRQQQEQQQLVALSNNRQVLANRASAASAKGMEQKRSQEQSAQTSDSADESPSGQSLLSSVKSMGPRGLIQPMAQMAIKNILNSFSQQAEAQQAQVDAMEQATSAQNSQRFSASSSADSPTRGAGSAALASGQDSTLQVSGSSQVMTALPPPAGMATAAGESVGRSMRSLPIGAQAPPSHQRVQSISDQEVQESYGQMPAYHMPPRSPHYGGSDSYQGDHDKKTKGITFHFGGGPIGGGTQLITSPMGIFKHLMIPLLPNPRVNLNGKVVFGVVLEKSTAFGPPPKKKHKFWG